MVVQHGFNILIWVNSFCFQISNTDYYKVIEMWLKWSLHDWLLLLEEWKGLWLFVAIAGQLNELQSLLQNEYVSL